jgi:hypothetical protein
MHLSEGGEGKAGWVSRRPLGRPAGGPARGRGDGGRNWIKNRRWAKVQKEFLFEFQLILEFGKIWKIAQGDLGRNLIWGFFLKSSRLSKYFRKMKYAMS